MKRLFGLVIFCYVDDCFWPAPAYNEQNTPTAEWISHTFEYVTTDLLGWRLDPEKSCAGQRVVLLGLEVQMHADASHWRLSSDKAQQWIGEITTFLESNRLTSAEASKLCGKISFLNSHVFGRLGRALLRPIVWRQLDLSGTTSLTQRLRWSLQWFKRVLSEARSQVIPYSVNELGTNALIYTDAESNGNIAIVVIAAGTRAVITGTPQSTSGNSSGTAR